MVPTHHPPRSAPTQTIGAGNHAPSLLAQSLALLLPLPAHAAPLDGKTYIIELSSTQYSSGYGEYLLPPLAKAMRHSGMTAKNGPGADVVVNVVPESDVGQWVKTASGKEWLYTLTATVGISPGETSLPYDGTPVYGVRASLLTPNADRDDELACLIGLAARTAVANYRPKGILKVDGQSCQRR